MKNRQGLSRSLIRIRESSLRPLRWFAKLGLLTFCVLACTSLLALAGSRGHSRGAAGTKTSPDQVLILYDADEAFAWGWIGEMHARMLANLLGHFPLPYRMKPVNDYQEGEALFHQATFYLGSLYGSELPEAFLEDVRKTDKTVCWFKYNVEHLEPAFALLQGTGDVYYHGETFLKHPANLELGSIPCPPGECIPVATAPVAGGWDIPYILKKNNFWYVADIPFGYISEEDRYLVFADVLHDILGITHSRLPRALIRIEDVSPNYPPDLLIRISDYLHEQGVPFVVSVIPIYVDPTGRYNNGIPVRIAISDPDRFEIVEALQYMREKGGKLFLHGYTHQHNADPNPWTAVSGEDFEFYQVAETEEGHLEFKGAVREDSARWVRRRISLAKTELAKVGLSPAGWVTPHYAASAVDYRNFASEFAVTIQRVLYFNEEFGLGPIADGGWEVSEFAGQLFPYVIQKDVYNQKVLPENAGYVDPESWPVERILRITRKNLATREPWASVFYHPFLESFYPGNTFLADLVEGIQAQGYTFVEPSNELR